MLSMMVLSFVMQAMPMQTAAPVQNTNDGILAVATDPPKRPNDPGTTPPPPHRPKVPPISPPGTPKRPHGHEQPGHHPGTGKGGDPGPKKPAGGGS